MKKVTKISAALFMVAASMYSCRSDQDLTAPLVNGIVVNGIEEVEHEVSAGDVIDVTINVSDNENLKQVKLSIHSADDGHGHGGGTGEVYEPNVGTWTYSNIINVSGTAANVNASFNVHRPINTLQSITIRNLRTESKLRSRSRNVHQLINIGNLRIPYKISRRQPFILHMQSSECLLRFIA